MKPAESTKKSTETEATSQAMTTAETVHITAAKLSPHQVSIRPGWEPQGRSSPTRADALKLSR